MTSTNASLESRPRRALHDYFTTSNDQFPNRTSWQRPRQGNSLPQHRVGPYDYNANQPLPRSFRHSRHPRRASSSNAYERNTPTPISSDQSIDETLFNLNAHIPDLPPGERSPSENALPTSETNEENVNNARKKNYPYLIFHAVLCTA